MKRVANTIAVLVGLYTFTKAHALDAYEYLPAISTDISDVVASPDWEAGEGIASFGFQGEPRWLRYSLPARDDIAIFTIDNPWLTHIEVYLVGPDGVEARYPSGNARPLSERPVVSTSFAFGVTPKISHVYVYDHGRAAAYFPVQLHSALEYSTFNSRLNAFHGLYYGIVLIMILYNLAMFAGTRTRAHLYYSLYAACLMLFLATADGSGALFLWPETPAVHNVAFTFGWTLAMIFLLEFVTSSRSNKVTSKSRARA